MHRSLILRMLCEGDRKMIAMLNHSNLRLVISVLGSDYAVANESSGEITYHCPYCPSYGKRNNDRKLYVNVNKLVYDCKRCGTKGSLRPKDAWGSRFPG